MVGFKFPFLVLDNKSNKLNEIHKYMNVLITNIHMEDKLQNWIILSIFWNKEELPPVYPQEQNPLHFYKYQGMKMPSTCSG